MAPNDSYRRRIALYAAYLGPNNDHYMEFQEFLERRALNLRFQYVRQLNNEARDSDSDSEHAGSDAGSDNEPSSDLFSSESDDEREQFVPPELPVPQLWLNVGRGMEILLMLLPHAFEEYVISNLRAFVNNVEEPDMPEPRLEDRSQEPAMARDFFTRGFRFRGQLLTPAEVDEIVDDFVSFIRNRVNLPEPQI